MLVICNRPGPRGGSIDAGKSLTMRAVFTAASRFVFPGDRALACTPQLKVCSRVDCSDYSSVALRVLQYKTRRAYSLPFLILELEAAAT
jgi:hypothetical protein